MMSFFINLNNDKDFWDILGIIFSIASFFTTVYIGIKANEISKNSLRPYLSIVLGDYMNHLYIKITNSGLGPGVIKNIKFIYKLHHFSSIVDLIKIFKEEYLQENNLNHTETTFFDEWTTFITELEDRAIDPNAELIILEKKQKRSSNSSVKELTPKNKNSEFSFLKKCLGQVTIKIDYINILNENKLIPVERSLEFFLRK